MERYYIYKLYFESGATYIGEHIQRIENDGYITSSKYYKNHPEDKLLKREIILDNLSDKETMNILETICIMDDKANNSKNVNGNLGGWITPKFSGWNNGFSSPFKGKHLTEEAKQKLSKQRKGISYVERYGEERALEIKKKIGAASKGNQYMLGKKFSEETKLKQSESHKGKKHSEEWNKKVGDAQRGKKKSRESVEKMRKAKTGKSLSEEHKQNISKAQCGSSYWNNGTICKRFKKGEEPGEGWVRGRLDTAWNKGKKLSDEQKQKLSESMKGRIPWNKGK